MDNIHAFKAALAAVGAALTALWGWFGWVVVAWIVLMVIDYVTGSAAALRAGEWASKTARDGIWHKLGAIITVLVSIILDGVIGLILDNVPGLSLPIDYVVFLSVLTLVWYIFTELGSITENAGRLGAPIPCWLARAIAALESGVDDAGDKLAPEDEPKE